MIVALLPGGIFAPLVNIRRVLFVKRLGRNEYNRGSLNSYSEAWVGLTDQHVYLLDVVYYSELCEVLTELIFAI